MAVLGKSPSRKRNKWLSNMEKKYKNKVGTSSKNVYPGKKTHFKWLNNAASSQPKLDGRRTWRDGYRQGFGQVQRVSGEHM